MIASFGVIFIFYNSLVGKLLLLSQLAVKAKSVKVDQSYSYYWNLMFAFPLAKAQSKGSQEKRKK